VTEEASSSRRRRWLVPVLAGSGALLLVVAASLLTLSRYAPLSAGEPTAIEGPTGDANVLPYGAKRLAVVQYVDRATMRYSFRLHNGGPVGLTVTDIDVRSGPGRLVELVGYVADRSADHPAPPPLDGHPSFALPGGGDGTVTLILRFVNCQRISPRTGTNVDTATIHYRGFGLVPRTQEVTLPDLIRTQSPSLDSRCPHVTADSRPPG
jgi:hypothetical protein